MKKLSRFTRLIIIASLIFTTQTGFSEFNVKSISKNDTKEFSSVEYMQGIIFGYGAVGDVLFKDKIEEKREITKEELEFINEVTTVIEMENEKDLVNLRKSILKQDPHSTSKALENISVTLNSYAKKHYDVKVIKDYNEVSPQACGPTVCVAAVVVVVVALAHQYAGVTYAAGGGAIVYLYGGVWGPKSNSNISPSTEEAVADILSILN